MRMPVGHRQVPASRNLDEQTSFNMQNYLPLKKVLHWGAT